VTIEDGIAALDTIASHYQPTACSCSGDVVEYNDTIIAAYHFEKLSEYGESDISVFDYSGNNNLLSCVLATCPTYTFGIGKFGLGAFTYDGTQEFTKILSTGDFQTVEFWFKVPTVSSQIIATIGPVNVRIGDDKKLNVTHGAARLYSTHEIEENTWYHIVIVDTWPRQSLYVNGKLEYMRPGISFNSNLNIGKKSFNGIIDEFKVYDSILSAEEIQKHYYSQDQHIVVDTPYCCDGGLSYNSCPPKGNVNGSVLNSTGQPQG